MASLTSLVKLQGQDYNNKGRRMVIDSRFSTKDFITKQLISSGWQIPKIVQVNLAIRTRVSVHEKIEKK